MVGRKTKYRELPLRMTKRTYTNKRGEVWTGYYYETPRDKETGKKKYIPLGSDLSEAKKKWAELEGKPITFENAIESVAKRFFNWAKDRNESGLAERTIRDYESYYKPLAPVFGQIDINKMRSEFLLRYYHERSSKYRGKQEIKFLSVLFNWARARGLMSISNPVTGITRQMKTSSRRIIYVTDEDFELVYKHGNDVVKDAMDIAYLTGQRPADVFKMQWTDIKDGVLTITQNKTGQIVRIAITGELETVLNRIRARKIISRNIITSQNGKRVTDGVFRTAFDNARDKAEAEAKEIGKEFNRFQFKDIRAKSATDSASQTDAQKLLGHKNIQTTTIYRRDKNDVVLPLMSQSLLDMGKKKRG